MKKMVIISIILCMMIILPSCSGTENIFYETTEVTEWKPTSTQGKATTDSTSDFGAKEEVVEILPRPTQPTTETQEETETESELPTQGVLNPNGHIPVTTVTGAISADDLKFVYKDATIVLNSAIEDVFELIGEDNSSKLISDDITEYEYEGFIIYTYANDKGIEKVDKIVVTDEGYSTLKGVKTGDYASSLKKIYGNPIEQGNGIKSYAIGKEKLIFNYKDNIITQISYEYNR